MDHGKSRFVAGDPLILQNEAAHVAWRIDAGEVTQYANGTLDRKLGAGELLGEEIVLSGGLSPYSAYAGAGLQASPISKAQLEQIFKPEKAAEANPSADQPPAAESDRGTNETHAGDEAPMSNAQMQDSFAVMAKAMARQTELMEAQHKAQQSELEIIEKERNIITGDFLGKMADLGAITPLMHDEEINDILINGHREVFIERFGKLEKTDITLSGEEEVLRIGKRIAEGIGREINPFRPMLDARLADGSRVNIICPPLAVDGTSISIRKFSKNLITLDDMVRQENVSNALGEFLKIVGQCRMNVLISGGTGSGKTTLLNAVSQHISHGERIVTIEDAAELKLAHPDLVRLETRPAASRANADAEVTMRDLVKNALRMRPDRIIVGEVRGQEAFDMMQAMNTGHEGSLTTVHANHPRDALSRLENMIGMANMQIPTQSVRYQIASALHLIVQISRQRDGMRRITHITEIIGMEGDTITMNDLFVFKPKGEDKDGKIIGDFRWAGIMPRCVRRIAYYGELPRLEAALGVKIPIRK